MRPKIRELLLIGAALALGLGWWLEHRVRLSQATDAEDNGFVLRKDIETLDTDNDRLRAQIRHLEAVKSTPQVAHE